MVTATRSARATRSGLDSASGRTTAQRPVRRTRLRGSPRGRRQLDEIFPEPLDRGDPRFLRRLWRVPRAGVVVERVVHAREDGDLVRHARFLELLLHLRRGRGDARVLFGIDGERRRLRLGADVLIVRRLRAVIRDRRFQVRARSEKIPDLAAAEAEADRPDRAGRVRLEVTEGCRVVVELLLQRKVPDSAGDRISELVAAALPCYQ